MLLCCLVIPLLIRYLDKTGVIEVGKLRLSAFVIMNLLLVWLVILIIGFIGFGSVNGLQYQIFAITSDNKLVHFWFKELLRDGKVVLKFKPYHKKSTKNEFVEVIKKKEEIMKDPNFEEFLCTLYNEEEVQKKSDILFEEMNDIEILKDKYSYLEVAYTIGQMKTKKKLKIYKNVTNLDALYRVIQG